MNKSELILGKQYAVMNKGELLGIATYTEDEIHGKSFLSVGANSNILEVHIPDEWIAMDELIESIFATRKAWITDVAPEQIFDNAMQFRSDANPFDESGELQVKDGYNHIKQSITDYLKEIMIGPEQK